MPETQTSLGGPFGTVVESRKEQIETYQEQAESLYTDWVAIFGPHDTPVPIDRAWDYTIAALERIQSDCCDGYLSLAEEALNEATWILNQEKEVRSN